MMRVLHITYWYPNVNNPKEALWVRNHVQSLSQYASQEVIHLNISPTKKGFIKVVKSEDANHFLIGMPINAYKRRMKRALRAADFSATCSASVTWTA